MNTNTKLRFGVGLVALAFLLVSAGCVETVQEGHVGVQKSFGGATGDTATPGLQIDRPGISYYEYDVREQIYVMSAKDGEGNNPNRDDSMEVIAKDEMSVNIDGAVRYEVNRDRVVDIYTTVGPMSAVQSRVRSKARECIRTAASDHDGMEMAKGDARAQMKIDALACMQESLEENGVTVLEVQIRDVQPPESVKQAVNKKEAAKQEAEAKQYELQKEELEAERKRIEAEGIKDAQETIDATLTQEYLDYLWITEGIEKGDTIYVVPSDGGGTPQLVKSVDDDER